MRVVRRGARSLPRRARPAGGRGPTGGGIELRMPVAHAQPARGLDAQPLVRRVDREVRTDIAERIGAAAPIVGDRIDGQLAPVHVLVRAGLRSQMGDVVGELAGRVRLFVRPPGELVLRKPLEEPPRDGGFMLKLAKHGVGD